MSVDAAKARILQRVNLADLIGEKVKLENRGSHYSGCCPFHEERSASFAVYPDHYHCYGCKAHGDAIKFVREIQGLGFMESLRYLSDKYGIECPELEAPQSDKAERQALARLYRICKDAEEYFAANLEKCEPARAYLHERGFQDDFIQEHRFGWSLGDPQSLMQHMLRKAYGVKELINASVALPSQFDHRGYDFFSNRVMIPISDMHGRIIAFGGRSLGNEQPKYKNSTNTILFDKSQVLYGLHRAKDEVRRQRQAIVCEGYMDMLQLWQGGVQPAVACLGTALTVYHLKRLGALTPLIYLVFDGDKAGQNATLRTVSTALEVPQSECKVVVLPNGHDPDTFIRENGADAFRGCLEDAKGLLEFAIQTRVAQTHALGIPDLVSKEFVPWLLSVKNPVSRNFLTTRIADLTGIAAAQIETTLRGDQPKKPMPQQTRTPLVEAATPRQASVLSKAEWEFFGHVYWANPGDLDIEKVEHMLKTDLNLDEIWSECGAELVKALRRNLAPAQQNKSFWMSASVPEVLETFENLEKNAPAFVTTVRQKLLEKIAKEIRRRQLRETLSHLKQMMMKAGADEQMELLQAASRITKELNQNPELKAP